MGRTSALAGDHAGWLNCAKSLKKVDAIHSDVIPAFVRAREDTQRFRNLFDVRTKHLSRHTVAAVAAFHGEELLQAIPYLRAILDNQIHFVALREVSQMQQDAPPCPDCGALMVYNGARHKSTSAAPRVSEEPAWLHEKYGAARKPSATK